MTNLSELKPHANGPLALLVSHLHHKGQIIMKDSSSLYTKRRACICNSSKVQPTYMQQSSLVRWGQYSRMAGPPAVLNFSTVAVSFAVGFWIRSRSSSPLQTPYTMTVTIFGTDFRFKFLLWAQDQLHTVERSHSFLCCIE